MMKKNAIAAAALALTLSTSLSFAAPEQTGSPQIRW